MHIASHTGWIISVIILIVLLLIVVLLLITVIIMYRKKLSVIANMTQPTRDAELTDYHEVGRYVISPFQATRSSNNTAVTLQPNPSYGVALQSVRNRELNDNYDYVVSDNEVISTDHNPSYIPTTVGSNQMEDNPAYKPAFVAII